MQRGPSGLDHQHWALGLWENHGLVSNLRWALSGWPPLSVPTHQGCVHRPRFTLCLCSFSQISMLFASSPTRMVSTRLTSSSTGATWLEVPSKCASGSLDKRGTPPWCRPMAQGLREAPQVTCCLCLSCATSLPQGRADEALQALGSQLPTLPRETAVSCLPLPGPFRIRTLIGNSTQHLSF